MPQLLKYLLHVSLSLNALYLLYVLFFRNTTFFQRNRLYLLFSVIAAFIIPALTIDIPAADNFSGRFLQPVREVTDVSHYDAVYADARAVSPAIPWISVLSYTYVVVLLILLFMRLRLAGFFFRLSHGQGEYTADGYRIVRTGSGFPFSFGSTIYLPPGMNDPMIIDHERSHIKQRHWIDLVLIELAVVVLWFNPVTLLMRRSIKTLHEFQADEYAVSGCDDLPAYLSCLMEQIRVKILV